MDPDPYSEYGSRKLLNTDPIRIRIHNTVCKVSFLSFLCDHFILTESLHAPAPVVSEGEPVQVAPHPLSCDVPAILPVFLHTHIIKRSINQISIVFHSSNPTHIPAHLQYKTINQSNLCSVPLQQSCPYSWKLTLKRWTNQISVVFHCSSPVLDKST